MPEFSPSTKKAFIVVSQRLKGFRVAVTITTADTTELLETVIQIPRLGSVRPTEMDISYGVSDDPSSARWECFLADVDPVNLPDVSALRQRSIWQVVQAWRDQGGANLGNPIQTMERDTVDWWNGRTFVQRSAEFHAQRGVSLVAISNVQDSIIVQGVIYWEETLIQRVWGDDNAFSDISMEEMWDGE